MGPLPSPAASPHRLLFVGSMSPRGDAYASVSQHLAAVLEPHGVVSITTSDRSSASAKLRDIVATMHRRRDDYDVAVIEVYSTRAFLYARLASWLARRHGKRVVLVLHGGALPTLVRRKPERVRRVLARADAIVAPSLFLAREVAAPLGFAAAVIPNPVDVDRGAFRPRGPLEPRLVWVRAFERTYRPALAVEVLARVARAHPEASLVMVGPDKDGSLEVTKARAAALGVASQVAFPGLVDAGAVCAHLDAADLFLNTTDVDNAPRSVVEAMAQGLCVVSTDVGGLRDLLADGGNALLVPPNDAAAMAAAVERLLADGGLARRLSTGARRAADGFRPDAVARAWLDVLRAL